MLNDQVALITGGTKGIGKAIAEKFAKQGAHVVIVGRDEEAGKKLAEELSTLGSPCYFYKADASDHDQSQEAVKFVLERFGRIDILVNNAGITRDKLLLKMTPEDWDDVLAVNVKSCYNFCRAVTRPMMKARRGKIINMSSIVGVSGNAGQVNYSASKAAVIGLTKSLAKELASRNIHVNCIAPGFIRSQMTDQLSEEQKEQVFNNIPLKRFGEAEDVANVALFLASPLSDYVTAEVLTVSGGL